MTRSNPIQRKTRRNKYGEGYEYVERDGYAQRDGHVERDEHAEWSWRTSLHANERGQERYRALSQVRERHSNRGGACRHGRRRLRNFQADQRPGQRADLL